MPITINGQSVNTVKQNGTTLAELDYNGVKLWPAGSRVSTFVFNLPSNDTSIDLWLTQSAARAVTVTMDDGTVLTSSQLKANFPYAFATAGYHSVTVSVADEETWIPGANFGSTNHKTFTGQVVSDNVADSNSTLKTIAFGCGVNLADADAFGAFYRCTGLTSIDFSASDADVITWDVFGYCSSLTDVAWGSIREVGNWAFHDCGFVELHIPSTIETVGQQAFSSLDSLLRVEVAAKYLNPQAVAHCVNVEYIWVRNTCLELRATSSDQHEHTTQWNGCNPDAQFFCEAASKPNAWGNLFDAYQYDSGYQRYSTIWGQVTPPWEDAMYVTFRSLSSFTLAVYNATKNWDGTLESSADAHIWTTWDGTTSISAAQTDGVYYIHLRGTGNTRISKDGIFTTRFVINGQGCSVSGNIETLIDYATVARGQHPTLSRYCYGNLFLECDALTDASGLVIPTAADHSCMNMFAECRNLSSAPKLPAMTLADTCYDLMFNKCTSLRIPPQLPARVCQVRCYMAMFASSGITEMPELPSTQLAESCYDSMFSGCEYLVTIKQLPATVMKRGCYYAMFEDCVSLVNTPELPSVQLAPSCYFLMFKGCTSLTSIPILPATRLDSSCYALMFSLCSSIKLSETETGDYTIPYRIPASGVGTTAILAMYGMFDGTGGTFTGEPEINTTYYLHSAA